MMDENRCRLVVRGMTCGNCSSAVTRALEAVPGVKRAMVTLDPGRAVVTGKALDGTGLVGAVEAAGFEATLEAADEKGSYDLVVIGGGSAGFAAAIRAHDLGARVLLVNEGTIGGTCVNAGCVPSKTLVRAAEAHHRAGHHAFAGISGTSRIEDFAAVVRQKAELVESLRGAKYVDVLAAYDGITLLDGRAVFESHDRLRVGDRVVRASRFVVATGSRPWFPPIPGLADVRPLTSTSLFELEAMPDSLIVLGGRYIALECAQIYSRFGSRVTVLQRSDHLLPTEDDDLTLALEGYLRADGMRIETGVSVEEVESRDGRVVVRARIRGETRTIEAERILVATGRRPITERLGLKEIGVDLGEDGRISVDDQLRSTVPGIFAAGDVIGEPAFVYTAAYEGNLAAGNALSDSRSARDYTALPWVVFTDPQVAGVGLSEKEAAEAGIEVEVARLEMTHVPRALAARDTRGIVKLLRRKDTDELVGARVLAPEGGEQIMEAALAIRHGISVSDLAAAFHPYLTQAEAVKLCAQTFGKDVSKLSCCSA